jgi:hypothetical protein
MRREALLVASWDHDEHVCCETSSRLEVRCIGLAIQCRCVRGGSWRREMDFSYQSKRASVRGWHVDSIEGTRRSSPTTLLLDYLITRLLSCSLFLFSLYNIKSKEFLPTCFFILKISPCSSVHPGVQTYERDHPGFQIYRAYSLLLLLQLLLLVFFTIWTVPVGVLVAAAAAFLLLVFLFFLLTEAVTTPPLCKTWLTVIYSVRFKL